MERRKRIREERREEKLKRRNTRKNKNKLMIFYEKYFYKVHLKENVSRISMLSV